MSENKLTPTSDARPEADDPDQPPSLFMEFLWFLKENKKWWLLPLIIMFLALALLLLVTLKAGPLSPFIYPFL